MNHTVHTNIDGWDVSIEITDDPKRSGYLIGRYRTNMARSLYGKRWQPYLKELVSQHKAG